MQKAQETRIQSLGWEDPLENEMATHSSVLAWKIPWTEEPGRATAHGIAKSQMQYEHILWCRKLKRFEVEENVITLKV